MPFLQYFLKAINNDLALKADFLCKLLSFLGRSSNQAAAWIQVFITFDRYIFVAFPKRFQFTHTKKFILITVSLNYFVAWLLNMPNLLFYLQTTEANLTSNNKTIVLASSNCVGSQLYTLIRDNVTSVFRCYLPCLFIMIGNHLLIRAVRKSKRKFTEKTENSSTSITHSNTLVALKGSYKKDRSFMSAIIGMDVIYLITLVPIVIVITVLTILDNNSTSFATRKMVATLNTAYYILIFSLFASLGAPFVINLKYNRMFRAEFLILLNDVQRLFHF